jgi:hypothetical protein
MTEIQLRIVDRTSQEDGKQLTDGDETMIKDGVSIRKFSKEAMGLGKDVYEGEGVDPITLKKIYIVYDKYVGKDSVFPVSNGAPRIMTKYKDRPSTYELQPEYASGESKFPCVKAMDWTRKAAKAQVIRGFIRIRRTSVVEKCSSSASTVHIKVSYCTEFFTRSGQRRPRSWLQSVRQRINKQMSTLNSNASTIPLATDEIKKLEGYK